MFGKLMNEIITIEVPEQRITKSSIVSSRKSSYEKSDQKVTFITGTFKKRTREELER